MLAMSKVCSKGQSMIMVASESCVSGNKERTEGSFGWLGFRNIFKWYECGDKHQL